MTTNYRQIWNEAKQLFLYGKVLDDTIGQAMLKLLRLFTPPEIEAVELGQIYSQLFHLLAEEAVSCPTEIVGDAWQNHLLERLLDDVNPFSIQAGSGQSVSSSLLVAARHDLVALQKLFRLTAQTVAGEAKHVLEKSDLPIWDMFTSLQSQDERTTLKKAFLASDNWANLTEQLIAFYAANQTGASEFVRWHAFRWQRTGAHSGYLEPVSRLDAVQLDKLIGYDRERAPLIQNTEQFVAGLPANNALLYGARGTGKSSTVKGLLTRYAAQGLRLIEVHKDWLSDYSLIAAQVRHRPEKFILFVDDLSFEAEETAYKDLKALLEGSVEARPLNMLIYATSNRRHLIKEQFSDNPRLGEQNEIQAWDTVEEKLSLADRFGLVITFTTPNQRQYLAIVFGLAEQAGLIIGQEELRIKALQWEMSHSGRSGRVARQFVDHLSGQTKLTTSNPTLK